jgi:hypothetical protein
VNKAALNRRSHSAVKADLCPRHCWGMLAAWSSQIHPAPRVPASPAHKRLCGTHPPGRGQGVPPLLRDAGGLRRAATWVRSLRAERPRHNFNGNLMLVSNAK